ncbi:MAG: hypothetical protein ACJLTB_00940 [Algoriphagus aquaeductus]|uniref:hypothetical protein n=1 Tax=Algoriphagus aquaeductus TaxID=475299 RepID=UPI0038797CD8
MLILYDLTVKNIQLSLPPHHHHHPIRHIQMHLLILVGRVGDGLVETLEAPEFLFIGIRGLRASRQVHRLPYRQGSAGAFVCAESGGDGDGEEGIIEYF